mmetsp:Transcript_110862/g.278698  ORF Transcript_110862/g.278698 Transcript_110862/m.278698 type:complete len:267 (+) Transcript_110862:3-803(+)
MACCCCFTHYEDVRAPDIGDELIESDEMGVFNVTGDSMPLVEVQVPSQMTMIGEAGALSYFEDGFLMESKFDDGAHAHEQSCCQKCRMSCRRSCSGENMSLVHFTNQADSARTLGFASNLPGHIIAINLNEVPENVLFTMNGSFMMGTKGTRIDLARADCKQCCFGAGLCFQKLDGNGTVFLNAGGSVIKQSLDGETHRIDPQSLVAFTKGLSVSVQKAGTCMTMCCGGEGLALTTLSGTGDYWLASSPWSAQVQYALQFLPPKKS